jgi:hypothetical protein
MSPSLSRIAALGAFCALFLALPGSAETDAERADNDRIAELERKVELLAEELERQRTTSAVPDDAELKSEWGLGPAASKIYGITQGLSLGGYAEAKYTGYVSDKGESRNNADFVRAVLYVGYKFTDWLVFNSEIEFEHATTSQDGSVSVEFATLDFLWRDELNARLGLMLLPMGFVNEIHEPPFYYGNNRPEAERRIIPSTWRENGGGIFGSLLGDMLQYNIYAVNGFDATGFDQRGFRGGRQKGSEALAEDIALVAGLDVTPLPELLVGGSVYVGESGQNQDVSVMLPGGGVDSRFVPDARTVIYEFHAQLHTHGLKARGLITKAHVNQAGKLSDTLQPVTAGGGIGEIGAGKAVANEMFGAYAEAGYDVWRLFAPDSEVSLEPFYRYEFVDTQYDVPSGYAKDSTQRNTFHTVGMSLKPIPQVVLKVDYRNRDNRGGSQADEVNLGFGLVF